MTREELKQEKREDINKENRKKTIIFLFKTLLIIIFIVLLLSFYNYYIATSKIIIKEKRLVSEQLPDSFNGLKIVHFSDLGYGSNIFIDDVKKTVKVINSRKPDLVIFSGDLIDKNYKMTKKEQKELTSALLKIDSKIGKYCVLGDRDSDLSKEILKNSDFTLLTNEYDLIYNNSNNPILIIGLDSYLKGKKDLDKAFEYYQIPDHNADIYSIVVLHEPDYFDEFKSEYTTNLVLAGHSHNGYIRIPKLGAITKKEKGAKKYRNFEYKFDKTNFFITSGIDTDGNGIRLFNHPSISLFRLSNY